MPGGEAWRSAVAFALVDARNVRREALLGVMLAAPVLLAVALRVGYGPAEAWVDATHGLDLAPHRPFVLAAGVVLHVPWMFGLVGALLILDDLDDGVLRAVRTSPVTLDRYLGYRLATAAAASLAGVLVAVPMSGLVPLPRLAWLLPSLVLAAVSAPLAMLAALAVAGNKIEGMATLKALGLPFMAPLAAWFLAFPGEALLTPLPTYWPVRGLWAGVDGSLDVPAVTVGGLVMAAVGVALLRRVRARLGART